MALSSAELPNFVCGEPCRPGTKSTEWPRCHPDASSGPSAPPHRADTAARATSWSRIVVVSQPESNASSPVAREIDPTLCRPAGPSRRILCQLPRRCIARARNLCTNWLHQLQLRQLQLRNCSCCTGTTVASSVRGPRNASASRQSGHPDTCSAAAASQQQAQRPRQTACREKAGDEVIR